MSGKLICTFCDTEVEEDTSNGPKTDSRTMLAKYNTQVGLCYCAERELLQKVEFHLKLSRELFRVSFDVKCTSLQWSYIVPYTNGQNDH